MGVEKQDFKTVYIGKRVCLGPYLSKENSKWKHLKMFAVIIESLSVKLDEFVK